jgi:hypothetical protein
VVLWQRGRRAAAVVVLSVAALTRETMLLAVFALALWELVHVAGDRPTRVRRILPLAVPFAAYLTWIVLLRVQLGNWPFNRSHDRLSAPGVGVLDALGRGSDQQFILFWVVIGAAICVAAVALARSDVLTWITATFGLFALMLGPDVWLTNAGFQRALLPLFVFGPVAVLGGLRARRTGQSGIEVRSGDAEQRREEPAGVALRRLRHVFR